MPLRNPKAKGSRAERKTVALLESQGYLCSKSGGSLGMFDVFAVGPDVLLVQVKAGKAKPTKKELQAMENLPVAPFVKKVLHTWKDRVKEPEVFYLNSQPFSPDGIVE